MKRKILLLGAAAALFAGSTMAADTIPLKAVNKANEVIDAAIEAHGGADALDGLKTFIQESKFVNFAVGQSRKPGKPWDENRNDNFVALDLENEIFVGRTAGEGGGFTFDNGTIINGEQSYQLDYRRNTAAPIAEPDYDTNSGPTIRVTPALLMKQLMARRQTSHWLGETVIDGKKHDIITLVMEVGPALSLYFDQESHMLTRMERVLPPFGQVEYAFLDYKTVDGIPLNQAFKLYVNGDLNLVIEDLVQKINPPVEQLVVVPSNLQRIPEVTPNEFATNEVDEGVFLIGGQGAYSLFVEMDEYVVAVGGTQGAAQRIKALREQISDKPIRYAVLTHHHNDHIPAASDFASEGATLITFKENEQVVRDAGGDNELKLQFVDDHLTLGAGDRRVELYNIGPTPHVENMLIAYLPKEGIIFEGDHFPQPQTGPMPPAVPATVAFARAIDRLGLEYSKILGEHSPRIGSSADLEAMLSHPSAAATGSR